MTQSFVPKNEADRLIKWISESIFSKLKKEGGVIGVSGGIDSATALALSVKALGSGRVVALTMPERDSSSQSSILALDLANRLGVNVIQKDITNLLDATGCYKVRDNAVKRVVTDFDPQLDKFKIVLPQNLLSEASLNIFSVVVIKPDGNQIRRRLVPNEFMHIVSASNIKQRLRMVMLYFEAELRNYGVIGTANRNEHELGFFVKYGDGGVDLQPLKHLYKTEVIELAKYLGIPEAIISRKPTTDTYSADTSQEEFFYRLSFNLLDGIWQAYENRMPLEQIARCFGLTLEQVNNVIADIQDKQRTTEYLRLPPLSLK